jgi:hypothetical protein
MILNQHQPDSFSLLAERLPVSSFILIEAAAAMRERAPAPTARQ